jgi:hypothetical protein
MKEETKYIKRTICTKITCNDMGGQFGYGGLGSEKSSKSFLGFLKSFISMVLGIIASYYVRNLTMVVLVVTSGHIFGTIVCDL